MAQGVLSSSRAGKNMGDGSFGEGEGSSIELELAMEESECMKRREALEGGPELRRKAAAVGLSVCEIMC